MARAEGIILSYRRGTNTQYTSQVLVRLLVNDVKEAKRLIGAKVRLVDRYGNVYRGRILKLHGARNPVVIVRFNRNIPGQALGSRVIVE